MIEIVKKSLSQIIIASIVLIFFWQVFLKGLLPMPSDTIVGLYHPFRDYYAKDYPRGIPFKNFLITDPIRQIIPWKNLSVELLAKFELPLWNPYEMAGKPNLANFQSSVFYPLNIVLFIKPFYISWTVFIISQILLSAIFMFLYLKNLKLDDKASLLGSISFSLSGFSIAWLEWGNIVHTALWLPLILLSIDKIFERSKNQEARIKNVWGLVFLIALVSSFFAGHLQIFFYVFLVSFAYLLFRWFEHGRKFRILILFTIYYLLFTIATAIQWVPTLQFISLSARSLDQNYLAIEGWFIPIQHLVQFIIPDFFGNPTTLNYWGTWNYGELVGYVGIVSLIFVVLALVSGFNKTKLFFAGIIVIALLFGTQNSIARFPYEFKIPFISASQPTRLIFLIVFAMSVLSAIGFDSFIKNKNINRKILISLAIMLGFLGAIWIIGVSNPFSISQENLYVLNKNLIFPSAIFIAGLPLLIFFSRVKNDVLRRCILIGIIILVSFDLLRFGWKFTPFTKFEYFYPQTKVIEFLKKDKGTFRIATTDSRIFPPNFSTFYKIQSVEGYDPLYLKSYAELVAASERGEPNINPPFGFNRIITPHNLNSKIIDLLNVKYILSLSDLDFPKFIKVFQEGQTRVYENVNVIPRAFFVEQVINSESKDETVGKMFKEDLSEIALVSVNKIGRNNFVVGRLNIVKYEVNRIDIETDNQGDGFMVLTDSYYPTWKAELDGSNTKIYKTNHAFRGILIPKGKHKVIFYNTLF